MARTSDRRLSERGGGHGECRNIARGGLTHPRRCLRWQPMAAPDPETATSPLDPLMSIDEVAAVLRISERGVYRLISRGELPSVKVGNRTLIEPAALRSFIANQRQTSQPSPSQERAA